ncbi:hypothetical protein Pla22_39830 [Rubripirellula amarantea]|uniref:Uncharacterized protein n=1 Tax=Rubripirellula amarantea TaxID=2527999 RepID=A0A5C5WK98_9BACT|nr:hypothetical protein Pla22_39830 [Rubripirellula amarantea]
MFPHIGGQVNPERASPTGMFVNQFRSSCSVHWGTVCTAFLGVANMEPQRFERLKSINVDLVATPLQIDTQCPPA